MSHIFFFSRTASRFIETDFHPSLQRGVAPGYPLTALSGLNSKLQTSHSKLQTLNFNTTLNSTLSTLNRRIYSPDVNAFASLKSPLRFAPVEMTTRYEKRRQQFRLLLFNSEALVSLSCQKHEMLTPKCASFRLLIPQLLKNLPDFPSENKSVKL